MPASTLAPQGFFLGKGRSPASTGDCVDSMSGGLGFIYYP
jgi:hypothetical protein